MSGCLDGRARLWDTDRWTTLAEIPFRGETGCVAYSPGGRSIATKSQDGTARLWDTETFRPIGEPLAHRGPVDCLAFNRAGTMIATASRDGTVRLWDADTGLPIGPPLVHRGAVIGWHLMPTTGGLRRRAPTEWQGAGECRLRSPEMWSRLRAGCASRPSSSLTRVMRSTVWTSWLSGTFAGDCKSWVVRRSSDRDRVRDSTRARRIAPRWFSSSIHGRRGERHEERLELLLAPGGSSAKRRAPSHPGRRAG